MSPLAELSPVLFSSWSENQIREGRTRPGRLDSPRWVPTPVAVSDQRDQELFAKGDTRQVILESSFFALSPS